ncbi:hypothetical protein [Chitinophaga sp.]|uniref:hypothetical protein n=1 Tax=Chitinophaga sp. TaxID=1869181 RepID=UPI0031DB13EC
MNIPILKDESPLPPLKKFPLHKSFYAGEESHKISKTHLPDFIDVELFNIVRGIYIIALIAFVEFIKAGTYKGLCGIYKDKLLEFIKAYVKFINGFKLILVVFHLVDRFSKEHIGQ